MVWLVGGAALLVLVCVGLAGWLLLPTVRTFRGPAFEPSLTDEEAALRAQTSYTDTAGGAGGGM